MKRMIFAAIAVMMLFALTGCQTTKGYSSDGGNIQERLDNQQRRIDAGVNNGSLTRQEAAQLNDNLDWIKREYSRAKSSGSISREEHNRIQQHLDQNSRMIENKKNNPIHRMY